MSRWEALQLTLQNLRNGISCWHADISMTQIDFWTSHGNKVFDQLAVILKLPIDDAAKKLRLQEYLALRWRFIQKTHVDYTFNTSFPPNTACLRVAEALAAESEQPVVHFLMPSVKRVVGIPAGTMTLKEATEEEGQLQLHNFVLSENGSALLDVDAILNYPKEDTARLFGESPEFLLTSLEKKLLGDVSSAARVYFSTLAKMHRIKKGEKPSFYWMLNKVRKVLHDSSRAGNGNELEADFSKCTDVIVALHTFWRIFQESIDEVYLDLTGRVFFRYGSITYTFEDALLALFASVEGAPLLETERARALELKRNINFCCTAQLADSFEQFLSSNPDLLNISLPGFESEFSDAEAALPSAASLEQMSAAFSDSLLRRMPLLGDDSAVHVRQPFYDDYAQSLCDENFLREDLYDYRKSMGRQVRGRQLRLIPAMLAVLPTEDWGCFFSKFSIPLGVIWGRVITDVDRRFYFLKTWVQDIPVEQWNVFFANIAQVEKIAQSITVGYVLQLFDGFTSESKWALLRDAMRPILQQTFHSEKQAVDFMRQAKILPLYHALMQLFLRPTVMPWLEDPKHIWNMLHFHIPLEERLELLEIIFSSLKPDKFILNPDALHAFLSCLPQVVWRDFFNIAKPFINAITKNYVDFLSFFRLLEPEKREACLTAIRQAKISLSHQLDISGLLNLMLTASPRCQQHFVFFYFSSIKKAIENGIITLTTMRSCGEPLPERVKNNILFLAEMMLQHATAERIVCFFNISIDESALLLKIREIKDRPLSHPIDLLRPIHQFFEEHRQPENDDKAKSLKELLSLFQPTLARHRSSSLSVTNSPRFSSFSRAGTPPPAVGIRPPRSPRRELPPRLLLDVTPPALAGHLARTGPGGLFPPPRTGSPRPPLWRP